MLMPTPPRTAAIPALDSDVAHAVRIAQRLRPPGEVRLDLPHARTRLVEASLGLPVRLEPPLRGQLPQIAGGLPLAQPLVGLVAAPAQPAVDEHLVERGDGPRVEAVGVHPLFEQHPDLPGLGEPPPHALRLEVVGPQTEPDPGKGRTVRLPASLLDR